MTTAMLDCVNLNAYDVENDMSKFIVELKHDNESLVDLRNLRRLKEFQNQLETQFKNGLPPMYSKNNGQNGSSMVRVRTCSLGIINIS
jgi:hypothetical protein